MNKQRRKQINEISRIVDTCKDKLEDILSDEQDYYDNMPENLQGSDRGVDSETAIDDLTEIVEMLDDISTRLIEY